jgi:hypothetical protein
MGPGETLEQQVLATLAAAGALRSVDQATAAGWRFLYSRYYEGRTGRQRLNGVPRLDRACFRPAPGSATEGGPLHAPARSADRR